MVRGDSYLEPCRRVMRRAGRMVSEGLAMAPTQAIRELKGKVHGLPR